MRQDKARTKINLVKRTVLRKIIKTTAKNLNEKSLSEAFSALDKAVKTSLIPKGRADRQKSRLAKKLSTQPSKVSSAKNKVIKKKKLIPS